MGIAQYEHAVQIVIPVSRDLVQLPLRHIGRLGEQIAALLLFILHPALQRLDDTGTFWQDDGQTLTDHIHGGKELQFPAQFVVVALERLFPLLQPGVQFFFFRKGNAIDPLQHLSLGIATPVGARWTRAA